jgi:4,5-DOPA dioxygenase extradiol
MLSQNTPQTRVQIVYFSHGGGPLPILGDSAHKAMVDFMRGLPSQLTRPDAILVISAHWDESTAAQAPPIFYDYSGFPEEAYGIKYPAPGSPELVNRIYGILSKSNILPRLNPKRGFDR